MKKMIPKEYDEFYHTLFEDPPYRAIRINPKKKDAKSYLEKRFDIGERVPWCDTGYYITESISGNHPYHLCGLFYFQEPSAMAVAEALGIKEDDFVLDLCAAPGGKATHAAGKIGEGGLLVANEIIPKRAAVLAENTERMGITNAIITNEAPERLMKKFPLFFDKIIVDAPCSGEGMFRKDERAVSEWSKEHVLSCAVRQKNILKSAYNMLRPGGYIVYSTCTFSPEENEGVIDDILSEFSDLSLADTGLDILAEGRGEWIDTKRDLTLCRRAFPHRIKGEGHFIALMKKNGEAPERKISPLTPKKGEDEAKKLFRAFEAEYMTSSLQGDISLFGDNLYSVPHGINTDGIRYKRAGLHLGEIKKGRFCPSHAFLMSREAADFKNTVELSPDDEALMRYLKGETLTGGIKGYAAVTADGFPIGFVKGADGVLKNHYPKALRIY